MTSQLPAARRNPVVLTVDIIASVAILAFALVLGLTSLAYSTAFGTLTSECGAGPYQGLECNSTALGIASIGLVVVTVLLFALGFGMAIVSVLRKRLVFVWPLGALILMIAVLYLAIWIAGQTAAQ